MPCIITSDFEKSLISSIKQEIPESKIHGCYFHLKQAIRKKAIKYKISIILSKMKSLTQISHSEINDAITDIQTFFSRKIRFDPSLWNVSEVESAGMVNITNNAIMRYNRRLNENFSNAHLNLYGFGEVIKQEFEYYQERCTEMRKNASEIIFRHPQNTQN
ncbi:hypothetical protein HZS_1232 [Henneguya salminicola]|nr:hypothetical protein HZS_1232 [Henneguya salminicola]